MFLERREKVFLRTHLYGIFTSANKKLETKRRRWIDVIYSASVKRSARLRDVSDGGFIFSSRCVASKVPLKLIEIFFCAAFPAVPDFLTALFFISVYFYFISWFLLLRELWLCKTFLIKRQMLTTKSALVTIAAKANLRLIRPPQGLQWSFANYRW